MQTLFNGVYVKQVLIPVKEIEMEAHPFNRKLQA